MDVVKLYYQSTTHELYQLDLESRILYSRFYAWGFLTIGVRAPKNLHESFPLKSYSSLVCENFPLQKLICCLTPFVASFVLIELTCHGTLCRNSARSDNQPLVIFSANSALNQPKFQ